MPNKLKKKTGALLIISINAVVLFLFFTGFLLITDNYIERRRKSTIIYKTNALRRQSIVHDQKYSKGDVAFTINSLGMRGEMPLARKPEKTFRIVVMGGSSVFDHRSSTSWAENLGPLLSKMTKCKVESFNAGVPGYSTRESLAYYHDTVFKLKPDAVLLYHGWNDIKYIVSFDSKFDVDSFFRVRDRNKQYRFLTAPRPVRNWLALKIMLKDFFSGSTTLQENTAKGSNKKTENKESTTKPGGMKTLESLYDRWKCSKGIAYFSRNVTSFVQNVKNDGATPILVAQTTLVTKDLPEKYRKKIAYKFIGINHRNLVVLNDVIADVLANIAHKENVPFIDLRQQMNGNPDYFGDHVHMRPEGSKVFAEHLARSLFLAVETLASCQN
jgi:lysophospholipase L1-like esterase